MYSNIIGKSSINRIHDDKSINIDCSRLMKIYHNNLKQIKQFETKEKIKWINITMGLSDGSYKFIGINKRFFGFRIYIGNNVWDMKCFMIHFKTVPNFMIGTFNPINAENLEIFSETIRYTTNEYELQINKSQHNNKSNIIEEIEYDSDNYDEYID